MKRALPLTLGLLALAAAWLLPLGDLLPGPFSAHMTMHMSVVAVAAPLLALALAGTKLDPVRYVPSVFSPLPASVAELVAVWGWHAPALHHFARHVALGLVLEQGTFLVSGLLVWLSVFGGTQPRVSARRGSGVLALLLTSMHMTLLGALLALPSRVLYSHAHHPYADRGHEHGSFEAVSSALDDQHLGGAIMLIVGGIVYLAGALWLMRGLLVAFDAAPQVAARSDLRERT